jgi:hypothetical protein
MIINVETGLHLTAPGTPDSYKVEAVASTSPNFVVDNDCNSRLARITTYSLECRTNQKWYWHLLVSITFVSLLRILQSAFVVVC